jgi:MarR family transcriptional regulator, organic hydroperoxide resistance regulator
MDHLSDYSRDAGGEALAARLRRLSERIDRDATQVYASQKVVFEQRWYGLLNQLVINGPMSIGDIASALRITHVSVSQASRSLEAAGIVTSDTDPSDARRRQLQLSPKGTELVAQLSPIWSALNAVAEELNAEAGDVVRLLNLLDDALAQKSLLERVIEKLGSAEKI